jgi:Dolichyl-phosphate-mannose-protein mannosyltransferase
MLTLWVLAALACAGGLIAPPPSGAHGGGEQLLDLVRVVATTALAVTLLLGPGVVLRAGSTRWRGTGLAFVPLPGLALLIAAGTLAWVIGDAVEPRIACLTAVSLILAWLLAAAFRLGPQDLLQPEERGCLLIVGFVLGLAVARALWSLGPEGELYGGTISRTLEVGDRSDSRISFIIPQLVAHGSSPYGGLASTFFAPYNFSSRGPLPGLAGTPIVLASGGRPPATFAEQPWQPFDAEGFMAYRLAMMAFACTAFVSLWDLTRRLAGSGAARFALLLAATTPFLVHEVWFTWPKMLAASFTLMAGISVIGNRPLRAGLLVGLGYLMHPVALLSLPALALLALWPLAKPRWKRPRLRHLALLLAGIGAFALAWRLFNGSHYSQNGFAEYLLQAGSDPRPSPGPWVTYRLESVANTLVPLLLPFASADNGAINVVGGISPPPVHFFFQYWTTLPFGVGIVFFPMLSIGLWRAGRRWPWPVIATVVVPFVSFAIYWGASSTGMLREGLQAWILTVFAALACEQAASGFGWLSRAPLRAILALRAAEILAMAILPTLTTAPELLGDDFVVIDVLALTAMLAFGIGLAALVWSMSPDRLRQ